MVVILRLISHNSDTVFVLPISLISFNLRELNPRQFSIMADTIFVPAEQMKQTFLHILKQHGFTEAKALTCAEIFTANSIDGVYSHGVNRFGRFIEYLREGHIRKDAEPVLIQARKAIEHWDGQFGPGPLNALHATDRAMELAAEYGLGCVTLANNNHWMRAGYYGWKAAKSGYAFISWTNTIGNMPAWNAWDRRLGNNPLVLAIPFQDEAIVLDMAMSQYSYGKMELAAMRNEQLPTAGGFDADGNLTTNPQSIIESGRFLPIGFWKGAGLSFLLDIFATLLSGGMPTHEVTRKKIEWSSQIFIAIELKHAHNYSSMARILQGMVYDYHQSIPVADDKKISYPGENVLITRKKNLENGIPVIKKVWEEISVLSSRV
jgi:3-dehydro-L-gulonate 2-dehydrogenase